MSQSFEKELKEFLDGIRFRENDHSLLQDEWTQNVLRQIISYEKTQSSVTERTKGGLRSTSSVSPPLAHSKVSEIAALLFNFFMANAENFPTIVDHVANEISESASSYLASLLSLEENRSGIFTFNALRARILALQWSIKAGYGYRSSKEKGAITIDKQEAEKGATIEYKIYTSNRTSAIAKSLAAYANSFLSLPIIIQSEESTQTSIRVKYSVSVIENESISLGLKRSVLTDKDDRSVIAVPLFVIGVLNKDHLDELDNIKQICKSFNLWLHVEGNSLGALVRNHSKVKKLETSPEISSIWKDIETAREANSLLIKTESIDALSNLHSSPYWITSKEISNSSLYGLDDRLCSIGIWLCFRTASDGLIPVHIFENIKNSFTKATELIELAYKRLSNIPSIQFLDSSSRTINGISHLYFRYLPLAFASSPNLLNRLNEQILMDLLETDAAAPLDLFLHKVPEDSPNAIFYIGFSPLKKEKDITPQMVDTVMDMISVETNLIDATLACRNEFKEAIVKCPGLAIVEVDNFVGLGAVKYVPPYLSQSLDTLVQASAPDLYNQVTKEIDEINSIIADTLSQDETLFSKSNASDGRVCITIGVETPNPLTPELTQTYVKRLYEVAKKTEISKESNIMEKISEVIQRSIKQAQDSLTKEEEQIINQEGIIRQLPVVGSVWNWLSPLSPKDKPKVQGRSFNLLVGSPTSPPKQ